MKRRPAGATSSGAWGGTETCNLKTHMCSTKGASAAGARRAARITALARSERHRVPRVAYRAVRAGRGGRSRGRCLGDWRAVALQPEARTHPAAPLPTLAYCALQMLPFADRGHSQKPPESSPDDRPSIFIGSLCKMS